ncbi:MULTISPECIES: ABC transporter substrate-binding protein [Pseudomonas]|jgi:iron complex transport system substrate-binding protein|uniref:ABC transporter substrate-binding protein n=2 Tax=Pseudomonas putida group TaxID=136845 RepID=A0A2A3M3E7_PSEDL|nr:MULTISPECIES: ABC transporter substrate-binding protein [Pseudomonas]AHC81916.1 ABC transporter substrate-binding protein [Pseudomonas monteilii SB3078]AHC87345.1 ABC transporter substrate-binding protein [Pseudomonas monteilii SB3101]AHZ76776.1 periplasmic binding protein [Pseudomonas putida]KAF4557703.1 ABC transporter substrate-binding protein [Pseudomonas sp. CES]KGK25041.1 ABC transporter substrate-binding protein [Pseudomonas plecoglossicida]
MLPRFATLLAGLGLTGLAQAAATHYPLTVDNCGKPQTFAQAPQRAVTIGQASTEMLYALGLGDKLAATSLWFNNVLPEYQVQNAKVPRLADNEPSFEAVVGKRPQLVTVQFEWMVGAQGAVATREQFDELGIPTYLLPSDCEGKDNLVGADGTRLQAFQVDTIYKSVSQLAAIFDVQDRGTALNAELRGRLDSAKAQLADNDLSATSALFWFSSADLHIDPYVAGRQGVADFMLRTLGVRNVVESSEEWPTVGWETLAKANPTWLIIARMDRRRYPADDYQKKLAFLRSDPVTRNMDAVKHDRIIILDADAMQAGIRLFSGLQTLAAAFASGKAAQ